MKYLPTFACLAALLATALPALGQAPAAPPAPNSTAVATRSAVVLVPIKLAASTDGKGTAEVGAGVVGSPFAWPDVNLGAVLTASADTPNGVATLLGVKSGEVEQPATWSLGLTLSLLYLPSRGPRTPAEESGRERLAEAAYAVCVPHCRKSAVASDDKTFCDFRKTLIQENAEDLLKDRTDADDRGAAPDAFCSGARSKAADADAEFAVHKIDEKELVSRKRAAFKSCLDACGTADEEPKFCQIVELGPGAIDEGKTCTFGRESIYGPYYENRAAPRDVPRLYPPLLLKAGARVGHTEFKYRTADTGDPPRLIEKTDTAVPVSAGLSFASIPSWSGYPMTIEGLFGYESSSKASSKTVRWCTPASSVSRDAAARDPADPAESCQEATLDGPTQTQSLHVAAQIGLADGHHGIWRFAVGPDIRVPFGDAKEDVSVALAFPFYVNFASAPEKLSYHGLVKLAPAVHFTYLRDGTRDIGASLQLSILGQRSLFSDQFDAL